MFQKRGLFAPAFIEGTPCNCIIDTGADVCLLSSTFAKQIMRNKETKYELEHTDEKICVLGGSALDVEARCNLTITVGETKVDCNFFVIKMAHKCLLGGDFLREHQCVIDYKSMTLTVNQATVPLEQSEMDDTHQALRVVLQENIKLKPYTEMVVQAKVIGGEQEQGLRIVGPTKEFSESESGGIMVGKTLANLIDGYVPVRVVNLSPGKKKLRRRTEIAMCEPCVSVASTSPTEKEGVETNSEELPQLLQQIYDKTASELNSDQMTRFKELLKKEQDIFASGKSDIGRTNIVKHVIDTGDTRPVKQAPRRLPLSKSAEADQEVKEMFQSGIIEPSTGPWCSPIVLVRKKDGSTRFCVDYRKLNSLTKKDAYPLPRLDATLDHLAGSTWFSTLDLKSGYWQVEIDELSKEKTAFSVGKGLWQFRVMPFGLCNAPATFQRLMEAVLSELPLQTALVYIDDILVHAKDFEQEVTNLEVVFQRLRDANLKLNPKKCVLFAQEVNFLGHIVGRSGIAPDPDKVKSIQEWPTPTGTKDVRCFVGLCSYYRRFILNFADIAKPLHRLTEKDAQFNWSQECEDAFQKLKNALQSGPILSYPDPDKPYILDTDASKTGLGAVLSQVREDGREHVIAYYSRTLSRQESNYCVTRRELLAVVKAVEHFNAYLYGNLC